MYMVGTFCACISFEISAWRCSASEEVQIFISRAVISSVVYWSWVCDAFIESSYLVRGRGETMVVVVGCIEGAHPPEWDRSTLLSGLWWIYCVGDLISGIELNGVWVVFRPPIWTRFQLIRIFAYSDEIRTRPIFLNSKWRSIWS